MKLLTTKKYKILKSYDVASFEALKTRHKEILNAKDIYYHQHLNEVIQQIVNDFQDKIANLELELSNKEETINTQRELITKLYKDIDKLQKIR